eukprot:GHVT01005114.1.p1 GENE.GHVT01005114.1~~GHVT01005114.1.p1  ORF type:complete len:165 (+),score=4.13 GHVT01005114.1:163-657(+)
MGRKPRYLLRRKQRSQMFVVVNFTVDGHDDRGIFCPVPPAAPDVLALWVLGSTGSMGVGRWIFSHYFFPCHPSAAAFQSKDQRWPGAHGPARYEVPESLEATNRCHSSRGPCDESFFLHRALAGAVAPAVFRRGVSQIFHTSCKLCGSVKAAGSLLNETFIKRA